MKDFFRTCLEELELRTGIRQLYWLQQSCTDQADFDKKKNILLDSMVYKCKEFDYIPEGDKKKIISAMISKDQEYEGLNSRTIHKWMNMYKDHYFSVNKAPEEIPRVELTPEQNEEVDKLLNETIASFAQRKVRGVSEYELKKAEQRPKERAVSVGYKPLTQEEIVMREMKRQWGLECYELTTGKPKSDWISFDEWLLK